VAPTGKSRLQGHLRCPGFGRRLGLEARVFMTRSHLDAELAAGRDPHSTAMLELRAAQLLRPSYRRRLASALHERLMAALRGPQPTSAAPVVRDQISDASGTLLALAQVLHAAADVHPRGVAMVSSLLRDGTSPFYLQTVRGALEFQARLALDCLVGQPWVSSAGLRSLGEVSHGSR
jgi:hypothetical protein